LLNLIACGSFFIALGGVIALLAWYTPRIRRDGRMVCRVCLAPAARIENFICPACGNDTRQWGIIFASPVSPLRSFNRVLMLTLVVFLAALVASVAAVNLFMVDLREVVITSYSYTFNDQPVRQVELLTIARRPRPHAALWTEYIGEAYRPDGQVVEFKLSGPPWKGLIVDPAGSATPLEAPFSVELLDRWLGITAGPEPLIWALGMTIEREVRSNIGLNNARALQLRAANTPIGGFRSSYSSAMGSEAPSVPPAVVCVFIAACWAWLGVVRWDLRKAALQTNAAQEGATLS